MGWCRCTYLNCSARSDGKTHFYHYPVFDKVRCHQWLVNAQRLDFLNLKLSQLKNRVICEHHFKNEMFMNCKKERLVSNAVPTEHGPFVKGNADVPTQNQQLLNLKGQIENEILIPDKKATMSVKYGDYLFNSEIEYLLELQMDTNEMEEKVQTVPEHSVPVNKENSAQSITTISPQCYVNVPLVNQTNDGETFVTNSQETTQELETKPNIMFLEYTPIQTKRKPKINILSEEKYPTFEKLEPSAMIPISPSFVLNPQQNINNSSTGQNNQHTAEQQNFTAAQMTGQTLNTYEVFGTHTVGTVPVQDETVISSTTISEIPVIEHDASSNKIITRSESLLADSPNKLHNKKVSIERLEAIERKRKINKKIKEIINESLNSIDEQKKEPKKEIREIDVSTHLSSDSKLPDKEDYLIKFLDARMRQMENTLLLRIDANSQRIKDLKEVVENKVSQAVEKRSTLLLSERDEKANKRKLFEEIKKYLSSESKSLVYEDLFLKGASETPKENNNTINKRPRRYK